MLSVKDHTLNNEALRNIIFFFFNFWSHLCLEDSGEGHGNTLQCSCQETPMDRGAWWAFGPQGRQDSDTTEMT